uniref:Inter-alpha-trypsin inhibitor heavy chain H2 n=1 Tax=Callorhinchus milii TaxID=7868 RepID=V9K8L7_CALMI
MKPLGVFLCLLFLCEIRTFEIFVSDSSERRNIFPLQLEKSTHRYGTRRQRSLQVNEKKQKAGEVPLEDPIIIDSYKVRTIITSRFAETVFSTKVVNKDSSAQTLQFSVQIPKTAYITNFTMMVNDITFVGSVQEKNAARRLYMDARREGKAAGIIRTNGYDMENFKAEMNVPAGSITTFELHCQELLQRHLGFYEQVTVLRPGNLVKNLQIDVYIYEPEGIRTIEAPNMLGTQFDGLIKVTQGEHKAHVSFKPTLDQQRKCPNCSDSAIDGSIVVRYDVKRELNGGSIQIADGHFVHFFAPSNLPPLPKNIIFVIDVSGSMWGIKMKQTVEAMKTILDDLRPEDQFTIIDFNHNVRVWNKLLLPATSFNVKDAKDYVMRIQPSGGTNINEAILTAIHILTEANYLGYLDERSVSLIVLVSDGDPTVGEIKLNNIQRNVRKNMQDDFSLFCLGIGFDVDYDFLERIALENRGLARRIYANQNASSQLMNFYEEVATPLLKKINILYEEAFVTDVTQNVFDKYFRGSELVVAGKLTDDHPSLLHGIVTACSANSDLRFEIDSPTDKLDDILAKQKFALKDFTKQLWAYLTINQLLAERLLATSGMQKRNITQRILNLALKHQFVTPMTSLLVQSEQTNQRLLADSPTDTRNGCCTGTSGIGRKLPPPSKPDWALPPIQSPSSEVLGQIQEALPPELTSTVTSVENDPHFIIHLAQSQQDVCFNIDSQPGKILSLVSDRTKGVAVNGRLVGGKKPKNNKLNTYFGTIGLTFTKRNLRIEISTDKIVLIGAKYKTFLWWSESSSLAQDGLTVLVTKNRNVTISVGKEMVFLILLHRAWKHHPTNVDFLGFYSPHSNNFSADVHGLIGQFTQEPAVKIFNIRPGSNTDKLQATMEVKGHNLTVTRGLQKDYRLNVVNGTDVHCWFIHNSGKGFIDGHYKDYLVPFLHRFLPRP